MIKIYYPDGTVVDKSSEFNKAPTAEQVLQWIGAPPNYLEHVNILYRKDDQSAYERAQMWVDESGHLRDKVILNMEATKIYLYNSTKGDHTKMLEAIDTGYFIAGNAVVLTDEHELD